MNKILTISIAAYNVEKYIRETLDSLMNPDIIDDLEILVVNDGSKDRTVDIVQPYADKYPDSVFLVNKENGGWGSTLNKSISIATGKYFKQLDGDDMYSDNLPALIDYLKECETDIVVTPFYSFEDGTNKRLQTFDYNGFESKQTYQIGAGIDYFKNVRMHACTVKTALLKENNISLTEKCFYTDVEFMVKVCSCAKTISYLNEEIYVYRIARAGQSVSIEGYEKHYKEHETVIFTAFDFIKNHEIEPKVKQVLISRVSALVPVQYYVYRRLGHKNEQYQELKNFDRILHNEYSEYISGVSSWRTKVFSQKLYVLYSYLIKIKKKLTDK